MKKMLCLAIALLCCGLVLFSCKKGSGTQSPNNGGGDGADQNISDGAIWYPGSDISLIVVDESLFDVEMFVYDIKYTRNAFTPVIDADADKTGNEIIIGSCSRDASVRAYRALDSLLEERPDETGWLIYVYNGSLCLAYDEGVMIDDVIDYFKTNLLPESTLTLKNGVLVSETVNKDELALELRTEIRNDGFDALEEKLGEGGAEIVTQIKKFYALVDEGTYRWLLNLYCPDNGGFYYSQAARDNEGFLPDVESTAQALGWIEDMGLLADYGNSYANALPEEIRNQIISFVIGLQGEDGYYYHPQWGTNISDSRRGRDFSWSEGILKAFGVKPNYGGNTGGSSEDEPEYASAVYLTQRLSDAKAASVSRVVTVGASVPEYLENIDNFKKYLEELKEDNTWYATGSTISAQRGMIVNREDESGLPLKQTIIDFFDNGQNKETGLWGDGIDVEAINGFMKITGNYAAFGAPLNYIDTALESVIKVALEPEFEHGEGHAVAIYNIFTSLNNILVIARKTVGDEAVEEYRARILEDYAEILEVSYSKNVPLICDDGGFSYTPESSSATSMGVPVTLVGKKEGDLNSLTLCTSGLFHYIFAILGEEMIPAYAAFDGEIFLDELAELGTIIKNESNITGNYDFDDYDVETTEMDGFNGIGQVVLDETLGKGNHVLHFADNDYRSGTNASFTYKTNSNSFNAYVFEFDFKINSSGEEDIAMQLFFDDNLGKPVAATSIYARNFAEDAGEYTLDIRTLVASGNAGGNQVICKTDVPNGYNNIRLEYYYELGVIVVYVNDSFAGSTATLYNEETASYPIRGRIYTTYSTISDMYIDNVIVKCLNCEIHPDAEIPEKDVPLNSDGIYDFDDSTLNTITVDGVTRLKNNGTLRVEADPYNAVNKIFRFVDNSDSSANGLYFELMENAPEDLNAYVFEFDIRVNSYTKKDGFVQLGFRDDKKKDIISTTVYIRCFEDDSYILEFRSQTDGSVSGTNGKLLGGIKVSRDVNHIEYVYIPDSKALVIYVNDSLVAISEYMYNETAGLLIPFDVKMYSGSSTLIDFDLDNVKVIKENASVPDAADILPYEKPAVDTTPVINTVTSNGIYSFDDLPLGVAINGTTITGNNTHFIAEDKTNAANKVLNFIDDAADGFRSASLAIQHPFPDSFSAYTGEFDFRLNSAVGGLIQFGFTDAGGTDIIKINMTVSDYDGVGTYTLKFSDSRSPYTQIGGRITVDAESTPVNKIRFELYKDGFVLVYFNGTLMGLTEDMYIEDLNKIQPAKLKIASTSSSAVNFDIDNVSVLTEELTPEVKPDTPSDGGNTDDGNTDDGKADEGIYDFESSAVGASSVSGLTPKPASGDTMSVVDNSGNKVFRFVDTNADAGASLFVNFATVNIDTFNAYTFEFDMELNSVNAGAFLQLGMRDSSGAQIFSTTVFINDYEASSYTLKFVTHSEISGNNNKSIGTASVSGKTAKIRYEYYPETDEILVYVNSVLVGQTNILFNASSDGKTPEQFKIFSGKGTTADFYIDNIKAVKENITVSPDTGEGEVTDPDDTDNKDDTDEGNTETPPSSDDPNYGKDIEDYDSKAWA